MTSEEDFPSLKDTELTPRQWSEFMIQTHCLDKAKVKKVIEELKPLIEGRFVNKEPLSIKESEIIKSVITNIKEKLKKELGIE